MISLSKQIKLGQEVKDIITGFKGVVVAETKWLHGVDRLEIQPRELKEDGATKDIHSFDCNQVVIINKKPIIKPKKTKQLVKLGQKVQDPVSKFEGIVIGRANYLNGCARLCVIQNHKQGEKYKNGTWFDEPQLKVLVEKRKVREGSKITGGPAPCRPDRSY